jgi:hypothetical protein
VRRRQRWRFTDEHTEGKGDGEMAKLLVFKPADLTQLCKRNQGEFPFWPVYRAIDGRETIRGRGSREIPRFPKPRRIAGKVLQP